MQALGHAGSSTVKVMRHDETAAQLNRLARTIHGIPFLLCVFLVKNFGVFVTFVL